MKDEVRRLWHDEENVERREEKGGLLAWLGATIGMGMHRV